MTPRAWNHQRFGTIEDPVHKSHLTSIAGDYGCLRAFFFDRKTERDASPRCSGPSTVGNAAHETIYRALSNVTMRDALLAGEHKPTIEQVRAVLDEEMIVAADGREVVWRAKDGHNGEKALAEKAEMVRGLLCDLHNHVAEIVALERAYIAQLGPYWISGHVDVIYRPKSAPDTLALADWKTGAQLPPQVVLDHGYESGLYSAAVRDGLFIDRADLVWEWSDETELWTATHGPTGVSATHRTRFWAERDALEHALQALARDLVDVSEPGTLAEHATYGEFPSELRYVHLADYVPYSRKQAKEVKRQVQADFFGVRVGEKVTCLAGDLRGPAWYPMQRTEHDVPRVEALLRNVASVVRLGRAFEALGEKCTRCAHKEPCLNSGYELRGDDAREANKALRVLPANFDDGLGDVA